MKVLRTVVMASVILAGSLHAAPAPQEDAKPDEKTFRVKVESLVEATGGIDIRRVQVWTLGQRTIYVHLGDGHTIEGITEPEPKSKLHRADILIITSFRRSRDRDKLDLERWIRIGGKPPGTNVRMTDSVDPKTELERVVELPAKAGGHEIGKKVPLGRLRGERVELEVSK